MANKGFLLDINPQENELIVGTDLFLVRVGNGITVLPPNTEKLDTDGFFKKMGDFLRNAQSVRFQWHSYMTPELTFEFEDEPIPIVSVVAETNRTKLSLAWKQLMKIDGKKQEYTFFLLVFGFPLGSGFIVDLDINPYIVVPDPFRKTGYITGYTLGAVEFWKIDNFPFDFVQVVGETANSYFISTCKGGIQFNEPHLQLVDIDGKGMKLEISGDGLRRIPEADIEPGTYDISGLIQFISDIVNSSDKMQTGLTNGTKSVTFINKRKNLILSMALPQPYSVAVKTGHITFTVYDKPAHMYSIYLFPELRAFMYDWLNNDTTCYSLLFLPDSEWMKLTETIHKLWEIANFACI